ncbi:MAG: hypothetical protein SFY69_09760 [Planctomycetota bacterium]|nr:hypothetical protein [Planctomycetota bacterium]
MTRRTILVAALLSTLAAGGCYSRTVSTRGIGASGVSVQKPYRSETAADRWVDSLTAPPPKKSTTRWTGDAGSGSVSTPRTVAPATVPAPK